MNQAQLQDLLDSALSAHQGVGASLCVYQDGQILSVVSGLANNESGVEITQDAFISGDPADIMAGAFALVNPEGTSGMPRHLAGGGRLYLRSEDL